MAYQASHETWLEYFARLGYVAKGVVYGTVGLLASQSALDIGGKVTGSEGAIKSIAAQPFGQLLLILLIIGLFGYVTWRLLQAFIDPEHDGSDLSDIARRIGYGFSALFYTSIAFSAIRVLMATGNSSGNSSTAQEIAANVMQQPFGRWLVGGAGLFTMGLACYYFYRAITAKFRKRFKLHQMSNVEKTWATWVGRVGIAARGVVYAAVGAFIVQAALTYDADKVKTSGGALQSMNNNPTNEILLGLVAAGFIAYAIHMGFQARYRRIDPL